MQTTLSEQDTQDLMRRPVFVDPSGRRRRALRRVAFGACALFLCYVVVFVAALLGAPIPQSALIPLPHAPTQPTPWVDPTQNGAPPGQTAAGDAAPGTSADAEPPRAPDSSASPGTSTPGPSAAVGVTPTAVPALTPERPNSNAATAPPGLTKHSETKPGRNGR